jgi:hypothetical protein
MVGLAVQFSILSLRVNLMYHLGWAIVGDGQSNTTLDVSMQAGLDNTNISITFFSKAEYSL